MVPTVLGMLAKYITFPLNQTLTFANFDIYVAVSVIWYQQYVGQTVNKFSRR